MHQEYTDIIDTMTDQMREAHYWIKEAGDGPSSRCADDVDSKTEKCRCVATPLWFDEHGVPRFKTHHPDLCADIYADEVALLKIACQSCQREFLVQMSGGLQASSFQLAMSGSFGPVPKMLDEAIAIGRAFGNSLGAVSKRLTAIEEDMAARRKARPPTLGELVASGAIHYGDVPNVGCCPAGPTMNCDDLQVVEFWRKGRAPIGPTTVDAMIAAMGWVRVTELEIELPDAKERT